MERCWVRCRRWGAALLVAACACSSSKKSEEQTPTSVPAVASEVHANDAAPTKVPFVATEWSIAMPAQTHAIFTQQKIGHHGQPEEASWLVSTLPVEEVLAHFAAQEGAGTAYSLAGDSCVDLANARICLSQAKNIPNTLVTPVYPVLKEAPAGSQTWITLYKSGAPTPCPPCPQTAPGCSC